MRNTIVYLNGHQGVGKLSVARVIAGRTGAALVDNHSLANPVFAAVAIDRAGRIPDAVKAKVAAVRAAVLAAIAEDAAEDASHVFTDVLLDDASGRRRFAEIEELAARRGALFVPVNLVCADEAEYARRVSDPARAALLKQTDLAVSLERRRTRPPLGVAHPNRFDLDTGALSAEHAAGRILAHVEALRA